MPWLSPLDAGEGCTTCLIDLSSCSSCSSLLSESALRPENMLQRFGLTFASSPACETCLQHRQFAASRTVGTAGQGRGWLCNGPGYISTGYMQHVKAISTPTGHATLQHHQDATPHSPCSHWDRALPLSSCNSHTQHCAASCPRCRASTRHGHPPATSASSRRNGEKVRPTSRQGCRMSRAAAPGLLQILQARAAKPVALHCLDLAGEACAS